MSRCISEQVKVANNFHSRYIRNVHNKIVNVIKCNIETARYLLEYQHCDEEIKLV